ncbi:MAG: hypothetical protein ACM3WU_01675 [Bacillota bacterium]
MGLTEKYSRYRWKEGREKDLWSFVDGKVKEGASVTAALKEYGKRHNMSWLTARWKYYQVRKKQSSEETAPPGPVAEITPPVERDEDFLSCLSDFVSSSKDSGEDVMSLMRGLSRMATLSRESLRLLEERDKRVAAQRQDVAVLREVCEFLSGWLSSSQVDKVATLKDFSERLSAEVGRLRAVGERLASPL